MSSGTLVESKKRASITISSTSLTHRFSWQGSGPIWVKMVESNEDIPEEETATSDGEASPTVSILDVLKSPKLLRYTLTLFLLW